MLAFNIEDTVLMRVDDFTVLFDVLFHVLAEVRLTRTLASAEVTVSPDGLWYWPRLLPVFPSADSWIQWLSLANFRKLLPPSPVAASCSMLEAYLSWQASGCPVFSVSSMSDLDLVSPGGAHSFGGGADGAELDGWSWISRHGSYRARLLHQLVAEETQKSVVAITIQRNVRGCIARVRVRDGVVQRLSEVHRDTVCFHDGRNSNVHHRVDRVVPPDDDILDDAIVQADRERDALVLDQATVVGGGATGNVVTPPLGAMSRAGQSSTNGSTPVDASFTARLTSLLSGLDDAARLEVLRGAFDDLDDQQLAVVRAQFAADLGIDGPELG